MYETYNKQFIEGLRNKDLDKIKNIPKGDLHNHGTRGGNIAYIEEEFGVDIKRLNTRFNDLNDMQAWYEKYIKKYCIGQMGYEVRIRAAFEQAYQDGVTVLHMSFGFDESYIYPNVDTWINTIKKIAGAYSIDFIPEIAFGRGIDEKTAMDQFKEITEYNFFKSIDLCGDELAAPIITYKNLYRLAKDNHYILKAHVGEFGDAMSIKEAVLELELDHIQHGIAAVQSKEVIKCLVDYNIQLNICPSSNVILNRVKDFKTHPIKQLYSEGVKVTINSDDMLIFNQSVSEDYLNLYESKCLHEEALNEIRLNSLRSYDDKAKV